MWTSTLILSQTRGDGTEQGARLLSGRQNYVHCTGDRQPRLRAGRTHGAGCQVLSPASITEQAGGTDTACLGCPNEETLQPTALPSPGPSVFLKRSSVCRC